MESLEIEATTTLKYHYDTDSPEFIQAFSDFKDTYGSPDSTILDMMNHVSYNLLAHGLGYMVEGVGYLHINGDGSQPLKPFSGIYVNQGFDDFYFE